MNQNEASVSFEAAMERLEVIVRKMEQGNASLDEALGLFEEGTGLVRKCSELLDHAEQKVTMLVAGQDGTPKETEWKEDV